MIEKLNHDFDAWTDNGKNHIRSYQREDCNATETADHVWNDGEVTKAATCKKEGVKSFTCTVCGVTKAKPIGIDLTNHADYGTKVENAKDATFQEAGYTSCTVCLGCGNVIEAGTSIEPLGHNNRKTALTTVVLASTYPVESIDATEEPLDDQTTDFFANTKNVAIVCCLGTVVLALIAVVILLIVKRKKLG